MIWVRASTVEAALQAAEEGSGDAFQRMRELVAAAHQMKSPELIIFTQRHLGAALLSRGQSRNDQEEGREILQRALALAQATEIEHEVRWISEALQIGQNAP